MKKYFFQFRHKNEDENEYIASNTTSYDWPDKEWLPNSIVSLTSHSHYVLGHLQNVGNDWLGYASYIISDSQNKNIDCLQTFLADVMNMLNKNFKLDLKNYSIRDGILLFEL